LGGLWFEASLGKSFSSPPISKISRAKWTQAEECILCKHEVLNLNPKYSLKKLEKIKNKRRNSVKVDKVNR
jgi:hypothetical protein